MKNLNIFILAAGKGTRMNSTLPKILHSIAGKPMVSHVIDQAKKLNPKKIYLIVNKELSNRKDLIFPDVEVVIQKNQNGTADAIKSCLPKIKKTSGNALILYADLPLIELSSMRKALKNVTKKNINLLTFISDEKNSYGKVIFDNKRNVSEVIEQNELGKGEHHQVCNSGIFSCDLDILKKLIPKINNKTNKKKEYYLTDIFKLAYHDNVDTKSILVNEDEFMGVNNKKELAVAEYIAQSKLREKFLIKAGEFKEMTGLNEGLAIKSTQVLTIIVTLILVSSLFWFLNKTKTGKSMRAYSDNEDLALLSGIDPKKIVMITWIIAGILATIGGALYGLDKSFKPFTYFNNMLPIFAAAIVGGIGNPFGAFLGGYVIAFSEILLTYAYRKFFMYVLPESMEPDGLVQLLSTDYKFAVSFSILVIVLLYRPSGIFKGKVL